MRSSRGRCAQYQDSTHPKWIPGRHSPRRGRSASGPGLWHRHIGRERARAALSVRHRRCQRQRRFGRETLPRARTRSAPARHQTGGPRRRSKAARRRNLPRHVPGHAPSPRRWLHNPASATGTRRQRHKLRHAIRSRISTAPSVGR